MDWESIYESLKKQKFNETQITGTAIIKKIMKMNENNRQLFVEYHMNTVKNFYDHEEIHIYKYHRTSIIDFLLDEVINKINLQQITQDSLKSYFSKYYYTEKKEKFDYRKNSIKELFDYYYKILPSVSFDTNNLINCNNTISSVQVPEWPGYYPSLEEASDSQKKFYEYWLENYKNDVFIGIDGTLAYPFIYYYSVVRDFLKEHNFDKLKKKIDKLYNTFGQYEPIKNYCRTCLADAYLLFEEYDKCWDIRQYIGYQDVLNIKPKCTNTTLTGDEFLMLVGSKKYLTEFGKNALEDIKRLAEILMKDFEVEHGCNIIQSFTSKFNYYNLSEENYDELKKYIVGSDTKIYKGRNYKTKEEWFEMLKNSHQNLSSRINGEMAEFKERINNPESYSDITRNDFSSAKEYKEYISRKVNYAKERLQDLEYGKKHLFSGIPTTNSITIPYKKIPQIITDALDGMLQEMLREIENTYREECGVPKIGEGWVNETHLYYKVKEDFSEELVIHHGRPTWLGMQHLDIYFPEKNIAIEYQGEQHVRAVDIFGGEEQFNKQLKNDTKKLKLCTYNGCRLIYVYPDYDYDEVKKEIQKAMK